jgi:hypothetical protein
MDLRCAREHFVENAAGVVCLTGTAVTYIFIDPNAARSPRRCKALKELAQTNCRVCSISATTAGSEGSR